MGEIRDKTEALSIIRGVASFLQGAALTCPNEYHVNGLDIRSERLQALHEWLVKLGSMGDVIEANTELEAALRQIQSLDATCGKLREEMVEMQQETIDAQAAHAAAKQTLMDRIANLEAAGVYSHIKLEAPDGEAPSDTES